MIFNGMTNTIRLILILQCIEFGLPRSIFWMIFKLTRKRYFVHSIDRTVYPFAHSGTKVLI